jgi:hypothetical protein
MSRPSRLSWQCLIYRDARDKREHDGLISRGQTAFISKPDGFEGGVSRHREKRGRADIKYVELESGLKHLTPLRNKQPS